MAFVPKGHTFFFLLPNANFYPRLMRRHRDGRRGHVHLMAQKCAPLGKRSLSAAFNITVYYLEWRTCSVLLAESVRGLENKFCLPRFHMVPPFLLMRTITNKDIRAMFLQDFLLKRDAYPEVVTFSLSRDLIEGLAFLHKQGIAHGQLSTHSCFVDHQWNGVIGDWEQYALTVAQQCFFIAFDYFYTAAKTSQDEAPNEQKIETYHSRLLYVAPELLRRDAAGLYIVQSADIRADIYSLGVILYEIFTSCSPYEDLLDSHNSASSILTAVKYKKIRPKIPQNLLHERPNIFALIRSMWAEDSSERLTIMGVKKVSNGFFPKRKALMDNMLQSMENHNSYLEDQLTEKQTELETATRKLEDIREAHVPAAVAHACSYPSTFESIPVCVLTSTDLSSTITQLGITDAFVFLEKFQNCTCNLALKMGFYSSGASVHCYYLEPCATCEND